MKTNRSSGTAQADFDWELAVDRLYESVGSEVRFSSELGALRTLFGASSVTFLSTDPDSRASTHVAACDVPPTSLIEYHSHYFQEDEWVKAAYARNLFRVGVAVRGSDLVPRRELLKSPFWSGFLARHGVIDILSGIVEEPAQDRMASFITFQRFTGQQPYSKAAVPVLERLLPHLRRCLRLHRRIASSLAVGRTLQEIFQTADQAMIVLARDGTIIERNAAAEPRLDDAASPVRRDADGRLVVTVDGKAHPARRYLDGLQADGRSDGRCQLACGGPGLDRATVHLHVVHGAFTDRLAHYPAAVICTVGSPAAGPAPRPPGPASFSDLAAAAAALRQAGLQGVPALDGLTSAERSVLELLVAGGTAKAIARDRRTSLSTVHTQIASIYAKTGVSSQKQIMAFFAGSLPPWRSRPG